MRVESVSLFNYKRFKELHIGEIPESARIVVLVGPNGSGKSSLFDAFLLKFRESKGNFALDGPLKGYYINNERDSQLKDEKSTHSISNRIQIRLHENKNFGYQVPLLLYIRSAYRNESDFHLTSIDNVAPSIENIRFSRIIDADLAVSDNYRRLFWKRTKDIDDSAYGDMTLNRYRSEFLGELQEIMKKLFPVPTLELQDLGGIQDSGVFRFSKGEVKNFYYKNLSGGEKAAFDLLLDIFVKRTEFQDAIYCIDEPEAHMATSLHGPLLQAMLELLPPKSQLWIATHSIGFVRKAYEIGHENSKVVFIDFSGYDFDKTVEITPSKPNRTFWQTMYRVALADLGELISPSEIVICEGGKFKGDQGFDSKCYNEIFSDSHPNTLFISVGGCKDVENSDHIVAILESVAKGVNVRKLVDRDEMPEIGREEKINEGLSVLTRREIENYLYDPRVLETFLVSNKKGDLVDSILEIYEQLLPETDPVNCNVKNIEQELLREISNLTKIPYLGNTKREFVLGHLVPALKKTDVVFQELKSDIFSSSSHLRDI